MFRRMFIALMFGSFNPDEPDDSGDDLADCMNRFAVAYNAFTGELASGLFNVKAATRLSKLWRQVEKCDEWPRGVE